MSFLRPLAALAILAGLAGCHSAYINATIHNGSAAPISLVELDYPSASFGTQTLAPGEDFKYRFKLLGSGDLKLIYTDSAHKEHDVTGPRLNEGDDGTLLVSVTPAGVEWKPILTGHR
jgi:hypothetical protein